MQQNEVQKGKLNNQRSHSVAAAGRRKNQQMGYSRVKSGDIKRRQVARTPDMSHPNARAVSPSVTIGALPKAPEKRNAPLAGLYVEPKVHTVIDTKTKAFPTSTIILAAICTVLMLFMIISYVRINEYTIVVSNLKTEMNELVDEKKTVSAELDRRNNLELIEDIAKNDLGMVKIDEIDKKYVQIDIKDDVQIYEHEKDTSIKGVVNEIMSAIALLFK